ncbi:MULTISPECIES: glycoside hydrolase family 53 protein [unclassified Agarivorans]|uniref:glycoside hydrolase family 53 protein n=1 Tax=unclassified Agarivorans TaxID=2636026 RepID=UPI0026E30C3E|nr:MULTISPECIES: glycosyl hydrolase 53 family protein [unclassified Agarivorans]MDO6684065.1 glycosyl hydrolase 53 family protein [Agarivorans sp. 3_MG-2023]MDO6714201.1 glycosyl hydrolase 53 family protein [Agarivorans sp. 2_MG-2023]
MRKFHFTFLHAVMVIMLVACGSSPSENSPPLASEPTLHFRGVDASFASLLQDCESPILISGEEYPWQTYADAGINLVRLRVWVEPEAGYNDLADTLQKAQAIADAGMDLYIDFHYSDTWADPGKQTKPLAWQDSDFDTLNTQLYRHTLDVMNALASANIPVKMVQLGNEISSGMLWDEGRVGANFNSNWWRLALLLKSATRAVHDSDYTDPPLIMIHTDSGGDKDASEWFFSHLVSEGVEFDIIGLSFYPWWHGSMQDLSENLSHLAANYQQAIVLAEIAYPYSLVDHDQQPNFVWQETPLNTEFSASEQGQADYITALREVLLSLPNNKGLGMVYWAPDWISHTQEACQSSWDNLTLFDDAGHPLKVLAELGQGQ